MTTNPRKPRKARYIPGTDEIDIRDVGRKPETFTLMIYEGTSTIPFTMDFNDPVKAYHKFLEAVDFLNPHSVRLHNNELGRDVFKFDETNYRNRKLDALAIEEEDYQLERERTAQAVMRSCYSE
jgi:hypothetical protein